ncbi:MAG: hypothetical protein M3082_02020 [Candidatus Dormibacteraeota bacterium]|nr:hypothetical protein [Candidatus Dormibacteraeota bacterium]
MSMDSILSPESAAADFYLGSNEITDWSVGRCCHILGRVDCLTQDLDLAVWAEIDPPGPRGETVVVLAPRYRGDRRAVRASRPVVVNVLRAAEGARPGIAVSADQLTLTGVGEIYGSRAEADATHG